MEFLTILIVFAILSRIIEALGGGKKSGPGTRPPHPRRPLPEHRRRSLPGESPDDADTESPARPRPEDAAAEMIPDELWELLTGQKRQRPEPPQQQPQPRRPVPVKAPEKRPAARRSAPVRDEEEIPRQEYDEEAAAAEYVRTHRRDVQGEIEAAMEQQRVVVARRAPERVSRVVSLETEPLPERERHRRFHEKVDRPVTVRPAPRSRAARMGLRSAADLRRAYILREVLGPPKALEEVEPERG